MQKRDYFSWAGMFFGSIALLLVVVSFMAGPFSPHTTLEGAIADKAVAIKQAAIAALQGKKFVPTASGWDIDRIIETVTAVLAAAAIICGTVGGVIKENWHAASAAILFGVSVVAFQFALTIIGGLLLILLIVGIIHSIFS